MKQLNGARRDERGLLGGFGQHRVACRKRRCDLPRENRQRKVPRADTGPDAARRGACLGLGGVIAQEINRFAQFGNSVGQAFAGFARKDGKQLAAVVLIGVSGGVQRRGAIATGASQRRRRRVAADLRVGCGREPARRYRPDWRGCDGAGGAFGADFLAISGGASSDVCEWSRAVFDWCKSWRMGQVKPFGICALGWKRSGPVGRRQLPMSSQRDRRPRLLGARFHRRSG